MFSPPLNECSDVDLSNTVLRVPLCCLCSGYSILFLSPSGSNVVLTFTMGMGLVILDLD